MTHWSGATLCGALSRRFYTPETTDTGLGYQMHTLTDTTINQQQHLTKEAADTRRIIAECLYSHHYHVHKAQLLHSTLLQIFLLPRILKRYDTVRIAYNKNSVFSPVECGSVLHIAIIALLLLMAYFILVEYKYKSKPYLIRAPKICW